MPRRHIAFAHRLVERGIDVVYGHSSHYVRRIEIYRGRLILYGCGDLVTDYEGIAGHEQHRGDLAVMFFPSLRPDTGLMAEILSSGGRVGSPTAEPQRVQQRA